MPYAAGLAVLRSTLRHHPVGEGTIFPFSEPAKSFSGNTDKMNRKVLRGKAVPSLQTPTPQPVVSRQAVATQLCCPLPPTAEGTPFRLC